MVRLRSLALTSALALGVPALALAQPQWAPPDLQQPFREGFSRGERAGVEDARRGDAFSFADERDYRDGDAGYRSHYGSRDRYRSVFRNGFEEGYRTAYGSRRAGWNNGRDGRFGARRGPASQTGFNDGYEAGLNDARARRRFDPISEGRYRSADHGYDRRYGSKDLYKATYRNAFRDGYDEGYADGRRYGTRGRIGWGIGLGGIF